MMLRALMSTLLASKLGRPGKTRRNVRKPYRSLPLSLEVLEDRNLLSTFLPLALVGETASSQPVAPGPNSSGPLQVSMTTSTSQQPLGLGPISSPYGPVSLALRSTTAQVS